VDLETSRMTVVAEDLPVQVRAYGSRESVEVPAAMMVSPDGDVYLGGADGSVIELERTE
jgi:hypothetical protein